VASHGYYAWMRGGSGGSTLNMSFDSSEREPTQNEKAATAATS